MRVSGHTKLYCLIGDPVEHSLSPLIMNEAFGQLGIDAVYAALRVSPDRLGDAVVGLRGMGAQGANVTYPHKEAALRLTDYPSKRAKLLRAVNTLRFADSVTWGHNTDAPGTVTALEKFAGLVVDGARVFIFGAGGAARAAALGVLEAGAAAVVFCVRNPSSAEGAISPIREQFGDVALSVVPMHGAEHRDARQEAITSSDVIINATPIGMAPSTEPPLIENPAWISGSHCCFDLVYGPRETDFLAAARRSGALCLNGVSLLLAQAVESFRLWTGTEFDLEEMAVAIESETGLSAVARKE